jgi:NAD-dependent DNA ligase
MKNKPNPHNIAAILDAYRLLYYCHGVSIVSDYVFDMLEKLLEKIEPNHLFLQEVGSDEPSSYSRETHDIASVLRMQKTTLDYLTNGA